MKSFAAEVLRETRESGFNPVYGLRRALEARLKSAEAKRYGTPKERQSAYSDMRDSFAKFFEANTDRAGQTPKDPSGSQISFDWRGRGHGIIDRIGQNYTAHLIGNPYDFGDNVWGERFRRKHSLIKLNDEGATTTEWIATSTQPPIDRAIPFVYESKAKTVPLAAKEAVDLAIIIHTEYIVPNFDSLPMDKDPRYLAWRNQ
ncbi:MAG TPA: hypothetical protein VIH90_08300 [Candidatus Saccharimonadales bacterium]